MNYRLAKFIFLAFTSFSLMACTDASLNNPAPTLMTSDLDTQPESKPTLEVEQTGNKPNDPIVVRGSGYPENVVIVFYFAESEANLGPSVAQVVSSRKGDFQIDMLLPTAWPGANFEGESRLLVVAESISGEAIASGPINIDYSDALTMFENPSAGYSISVPRSWASTEAQITPLGELILLGPDPISHGNPGNSVFISTNHEDLDELAAAQALTCGEPGCTDDIRLEITTVNGLDARKVTIGQENTPQLDWFFVRYQDRMVYFTLNDPLTLASLGGLVQTFTLTEQLPADDATDEIADAPGPTSSPFTEEPTATATEEVVEEISSDETITSTDLASSEATTVEATETLEPTEAATPTLKPTDEPTPEPTETPIPTETATSTSTATAEPTDTAVPTNTPTPEPTATEEPPPETEATLEVEVAQPSTGPLQTSLDLFTIISRAEEDEETLAYFTEANAIAIGSPTNILGFLELDGRPFAFQVERVQGATPPIIRLNIQLRRDGPTIIRELEMVNVVGRWQINRVFIADIEVESTPSPGEEPGQEPTIESDS